MLRKFGAHVRQQFVGYLALFGKPSRPRHATVLAYLALFVALGGTGYAAVEINGGNIKDRTIIAKKVKKDTLTGTEIKEAKLGRGPRGRHAANATKLGGRTPSAYAPSGCPAGMVKVG